MKKFLLIAICCFVQSDIRGARPSQGIVHVASDEGQSNFDLITQKSPMDVFKNQKKILSQCVLQDPQVSLHWLAREVKVDPQTEVERTIQKRAQKYGLIGRCIAAVGTQGLAKLQWQELDRLAYVMGDEDIGHIFIEGAYKDPAVVDAVVRLVKKYPIGKHAIAEDRRLDKNEDDLNKIKRHLGFQVNAYYEYDEYIEGIIERDNPQELNACVENARWYPLFFDDRIRSKRIRSKLANFALRHSAVMSHQTMASICVLDDFRTGYARYLMADVPGDITRLLHADPNIVAKIIWWNSKIDKLVHYCVDHSAQLSPLALNIIFLESFRGFRDLYVTHLLAQDNPALLNDLDEQILHSITDVACLYISDKVRAKLATFCLRHKSSVSPEIITRLHKHCKFFKNIEKK